MQGKMLRVGSFLLMLLGAISILAVSGVASGFYDPGLHSPGQAEAPTPAPSASADLAPTGTIVADAKLIPARRADLSLELGGVVVELLVSEGEEVKAGQVLLRLDAAQIQVAVAQAEADLMRAQAQLDERLAGSRQEDIATAQATLDAANARLAALERSTSAGDLANVEAALAAALANRQRVLEGASEAQLIEARAGLQNAEAELQRAQAAYDQVRWSNEIGALPQSAALQTATNNYEAARARLADLENGATRAEIAGADASVAQAQAALDALRAQRPEDIAARAADVRNAQAQLDRLLNGTRPEQIVSAEAEVARATAVLQQQLVTLSDTELRAPFAGTIAWLDVEIGEHVVPGKAVLRLADLQAWEIETEDLTEVQVVTIGDGSRAVVTFDALPDLALDAVVHTIRPFGEDNFGDVVYRVTLRTAESDPRFRWNMSAVVRFSDALAHSTR